MLNIGNKVYRNMQEQVAYNSECIQAIKDYLDGLEYSDSLIVLTSSSGSLTAEEMAVAEKKVAFIYLNGELYVKSEDVIPSSYIFRQVKLKATEVGSAYYEIGGSKIVVTIGTATYAQSDEAVITVYNKSQIDSIVANIMAVKANVADVYTKTAVDLLLAGKANLSGADFTGAVTAPTFEQTSPNYTTSFNFISGTADIQITNAYNRLIVVNGVLYAIANIKMKNISGATKNIGGAWGGTPYVSVSLSPNIASKIYDIDGVSAHDAGTNRKLITSVHASCISGTLGDANATTYNDFRFDLTNTATTNNVACYFNANQYITLAIDEEICLMARVALTLF